MVKCVREYNDYLKSKERKKELEGILGENLVKKIDSLDRLSDKYEGGIIFSGIVIGGYLIKKYLFDPWLDIDDPITNFVLGAIVGSIGLSLPIDIMIREKYFDKKIRNLNKEKSEEIQEYRKNRLAVKGYEDAYPL